MRYLNAMTLRSTNWISNMKKSIPNWFFSGYTVSKNPIRNRPKIQFVRLNFSIIKYVQMDMPKVFSKTKILHIRQGFGVRYHLSHQFQNHSIRPAEEVFSREANEHKSRLSPIPKICQNTWWAIWFKLPSFHLLILSTK